MTQTDISTERRGMSKAKAIETGMVISSDKCTEELVSASTFAILPGNVLKKNVPLGTLSQA